MNQRTSAQIRADFTPMSPKGDPSTPRCPWLSLGEAASAIGVHPITLRRWADRGSVPFSRTVGGHRRFLSTDIEACVRGRRQLRRLGGLEGLWATQAQRSIHSSSPFRNRAKLPLWPRDRLRFRRSGQRLLSLVAGVSTGRVDSERAQRLARRMGRAYGAWATRRDVASVEMLKVFARVRQNLIDAAIDLVQAENLEPRSVRGLVAAMEHLTQAVEIGLLEAVLPSGRSPAGAT